MTERFIGLMSGTSLDGVDGVLADFSDGGILVRGHATAPFSMALRTELLSLNNPEGVDELHRAALAGSALARVYAEVTRELLGKAGLAAGDISAVGAHGQTVRHRPGEFDETGYTLRPWCRHFIVRCSRIRTKRSRC